MSRHRRQLGLLAILTQLGWQRDPQLWNVPCLDGHGHRAQLSVRFERAPDVEAAPPCRVRVVLEPPPPRPTVADIAARLAASAAAVVPGADHHEHLAAESRLSGVAAGPAQQRVPAGPVAGRSVAVGDSPLVLAESLA